MVLKSLVKLADRKMLLMDFLGNDSGEGRESEGPTGGDCAAADVAQSRRWSMVLASSSRGRRQLWGAAKF